MLMMVVVVVVVIVMRLEVEDDQEEEDGDDKGHEGSNSLTHPSHGAALLILLISAPAAPYLPAAVALLAVTILLNWLPAPVLLGGPLDADPALVYQDFLKAERCLLQPQPFRVIVAILVDKNKFRALPGTTSIPSPVCKTKQESLWAGKRATIHGMTWYKGQMMTASQLGAKPLPCMEMVWAALPTPQRLENRCI